MSKLDSFAHRIFVLMAVIERNFKEYIGKFIHEHELTVPQVMALFTLSEKEGISLNDLCKDLDLPKSTVSRIVDQLVNRGLVVREIPQENRRTVKLSVSESFKNSNSKMMSSGFKVLNDMIEEHGTNKIDEIVNTLEMVKIISQKMNELE